MEVYPLVMTNIAIEAMAIEIVDFPITKLPLSIATSMSNYQRVTICENDLLYSANQPDTCKTKNNFAGKRR